MREDRSWMIRVKLLCYLDDLTSAYKLYNPVKQQIAIYRDVIMENCIMELGK